MSDKQKRDDFGRPTAYKPEFKDQAFRLSLLGLTDPEMAKIFGVCEATFHNWKNAHPDFLESVLRGKEEADSKVVESLYNTALSGNTHAQTFWLKNRQARQWREKTEIDHTSAGEKIQGINVKFVE